MEKYFCESELGEDKALEKHEGGFCNKEQYGWIGPNVIRLRNHILTILSSPRAGAGNFRPIISPGRACNASCLPTVSTPQGARLGFHAKIYSKSKTSSSNR